MKKVLLLAAVLPLVTTAPAMAEPFRSFSDVRIRAVNGTTVIRAFPNATAPSFRLLLERGHPAAECVVWIEFADRAGRINHRGVYGNVAPSKRRTLVQGPLFDDETPPADLDEVDVGNVATSHEAHQHWVATKTNDALELVSADVDVDQNGACVAGLHTRFTANLAYFDVVDSRTVEDFGEERLRGFPATNPSFILFVEYAQAGAVIVHGHSGDLEPVTLTEDACILWLDVNPIARPFWARAGWAGRTRTVIASHGELSEALFGDAPSDPVPIVSRQTGEALRLVEVSVRRPGPDGCTGSARTQFAPRIGDFYR